MDDTGRVTELLFQLTKGGIVESGVTQQSTNGLSRRPGEVRLQICEPFHVGEVGAVVNQRQRSKNVSECPLLIFNVTNLSQGH